MKIHCAYDELVPREKLKGHPKNPNQHPEDQIARLAQILRYQGWRYPVKVSKRSGFITSGHGRIEAAWLNGWDKVPVNYQDYESEEQEYADVIADNAIASWSELDLASVNNDMLELGPDFDIDLLGIKDFVLDLSEKTEGLTDEDAVPEIPAEAKTRLGDLYQLGNHRLLCGDSTKKEDIERLMNGGKVDIVFTDPPYNVNFQYNQYDDTKRNYETWKVTCETWLSLWKNLTGKIILTPGCNNLELWCRISEPTHICPWIKVNANTTGRITHLWQWEPIIFIGKFVRKRANDVFSHHVDSGFLRDDTTGDHPCPKPVRLWQDIVENFSDSKDILFDPFTGSGTTLIACEKTGRRCFGMEIDPHYCDVIVERWEKFTGKKAELVTEPSLPKTITRKKPKPKEA